MVRADRKREENHRSAQDPPKLETPFKCYIYCTNGGRPLVYGDKACASGWKECYTQTYGRSREEAERIWGVLNGKVIGEFVCDKILDWHYIPDPDESADPGSMAYDVLTKDGEKTGLEYDDFEDYGKGAPLYGWCISDLKIYDEPKELKHFQIPTTFPERRMSGPPQSWCYVEEIT